MARSGPDTASVPLNDREPLRPGPALALAAAPVAVAAVAVAGGGAALVVGLAALAAVAAVLLTRQLVALPLLRRALDAERDTAERQLELADERAELRRRDQLERALRGANDEPAALRAGLRALAQLDPDAEVSLLLGLPDDARVGWSVRLDDGELTEAEPVPGTPGCAALVERDAVITTTSAAVDACGHLEDPHVEVTALCAPLRVGDTVLGTMCLQRPAGESPDARLVERARWVVDHTGRRVAEQRAALGPSHAGPLDPTTGLPGETALRRQLRDLVRGLTPFCVAVIQPDGSLGTSGSAAVPGEMARHPAAAGLAAAPEAAGVHRSTEESIGVLADAVCSTLRPDDLVCRTEGDRLVAVLPGCSGDQAVAALERTRETLALAFAEAELSPITCSTGIAESHRATSLDQLVELATRASLDAAQAGGNRVARAEA